MEITIGELTLIVKATLGDGSSAYKINPCITIRRDKIILATIPINELKAAIEALEKCLIP